MGELAGKPVRTGRSRRTRVMVAVAMIVFVVVPVVWLFWNEGAQPKPPVNLADLPRVDGTLNTVEVDRLVMTPFTPLDGKTQVEFEIPTKYRDNFDLAHLRSHSSVGIPTRIYYLEQRGRYLAVYKADAPANRSDSTVESR